MLPFLKIPVTLPGEEGKPDDPGREVSARIMPDEIASFHPGYHWGTFIVLKSGYIYLTQWDSELLESHLRGYWEQLMKPKPGLVKRI
jgi:hypothetical protein